MPILNERIGAHFVLLYEDGENFDVDEAMFFFPSMNMEWALILLAACSISPMGMTAVP